MSAGHDEPDDLEDTRAIPLDDEDVDEEYEDEGHPDSDTMDEDDDDPESTTMDEDDDDEESTTLDGGLDIPEPGVPE